MKRKSTYSKKPREKMTLEILRDDYKEGSLRAVN